MVIMILYRRWNIYGRGIILLYYYYIVILVLYGEILVVFNLIGSKFFLLN